MECDASSCGLNTVINFVSSEVLLLNASGGNLKIDHEKSSWLAHTSLGYPLGYKPWAD